MSTRHVPAPRRLAASAWRAIRRHWIASLALFFAVGGGGTVALAASTPASRTYYACAAAEGGSLNLTTKKATCPSGARKISFSARGARGLQGADGKRGSEGAVGPVGPAGPQGPTGTDGATGTTGRDGARGKTGAQGEDGAPGALGPQGPAGERGAKGETGAAGAKGDIGATGETGAKGDTGAIGPQGVKGDKGDTGATGAKGDTGNAGPAGPPGGGLTLSDKNGVALGKVVSVGDSSVGIITSTGYQVYVPWTGQFEPSQIYYTGTCGSAASVGTGYLNSGNGEGTDHSPIYGKLVVYSGSLGSLVTPATVSSTTNTATSENVTAKSIDNPACGTNGGAGGSVVDGWRLKTVTNAQVGLPATLATPFSIG